MLRLLALLLLALPAIAADWPHWRGPQRNGTTDEKGFATEWPSGEPPIAWRAKVGLGFSNIVVGGSRAFTVGHEAKTDTVFCFDAVSGKPVWKHSYPAELGDVYYEGGTTGTPTLEGDRLYWLSRWGDAFCFEAATGKIVWSKNVVKETGAPVPDWGFTGAVLAQGDLLICNGGDAGFALEKKQGSLRGKATRRTAATPRRCPSRSGGARSSSWLPRRAMSPSIRAMGKRRGAFAGSRSTT